MPRNVQISSSLSLDLFVALQRRVEGYTSISAYIRGLVEDSLNGTDESVELKVLKNEYKRLEKAHLALRYTRVRKSVKEKDTSVHLDPCAFFDTIKKP